MADSDAQAIRIIANPQFEPTQFLRAITYVGLGSAPTVIKHLLSAFPELLFLDNEEGTECLASVLLRSEGVLIDHNGLNLAIRKIVIDILQDIDTEVADGLATAKIKHGIIYKYLGSKVSPGYASKVITDQELNDNDWRYFLSGLAQNNLVDQIDANLLAKLLEVIASDNQHYVEPDAQFTSDIKKILLIIPAEHQIKKDIISGKLFKTVTRNEILGYVRAVIPTLLLKDVLRAYVDLYASDHPFGEDIARLIRSATTVDNVKCTLCNKRLRSWPGVTNHLSLMHDVERAWKELPNAAVL